MRYFKYIAIDNYQIIREKSVKFFLKNYSSIRTSVFQQFDWTEYVKHCPEILTAFSRYDLEPYTGFIYIIYKQEESPLHTDYVNSAYNKCRINIPVINCEFSKTFFYKKVSSALAQERIMQNDIMTDPDNESNSKPIDYIKYDENDFSLEKVDEVVVDRPTVMRVQEPHRVMIDSNHVPRVVLTIHTRKDPVYLLNDDTC